MSRARRHGPWILLSSLVGLHAVGTGCSVDERGMVAAHAGDAGAGGSGSGNAPPLGPGGTAMSGAAGATTASGASGAIAGSAGAADAGSGAFPAGSAGATLGGSGGGSSGGTIGTGGSPVACMSSHDCTSVGLLCDRDQWLCVTCLGDADCPLDQRCRQGNCGAVTPCINSLDCLGVSGGLEICDPGFGECVACIADADCPEGSRCDARRCVPYEPCENSLACGEGVCATTASPARCVECADDVDCEAGSCVKFSCRPGCDSDNDCTPLGLLCDRVRLYCVECLVDADCALSQHCKGGACALDACRADARFCYADAVHQCSSRGDASSVVAQCAPGRCVGDGATASCAGGGTGGAAGAGGGATGGGGMGGAGTGGGGTGGTGGSTCGALAFDPCSSLPHFTGTQTLDADPSEFCALPSFEFWLRDAAFAKDFDTVIAPSELAGLPHRARVWVAWSEAAMHLFARVVDPAVYPNSARGQLWDGDSVEFLISAAALSGSAGWGPPSGDGPYQIFIAPPGAEVGATAEYTSYGSVAPEWYAARVTADGYDVEARIPWTAAAGVAAGSTIGFNFALNTDENNLHRDYHGTFAFNCSGQACDLEPYWDASTWCAPVAAE